MRGATAVRALIHRHFADFNPRSPCGERREALAQALRHVNFNPRSPCGERLQHVKGLVLVASFQSTLPVRGATLRRGFKSSQTTISIHAPRAGSDPLRNDPARQGRISIHAPRAGSDLRFSKRRAGSNNFNPRSPCGERLGTWCHWGPIHQDFNPRSPCGERRAACKTGDVEVLFHSTLPVRGATLFKTAISPILAFQSTLPVRGATEVVVSTRNRVTHFNPRSPCGERPVVLDALPAVGGISIHAPRAGSDSNFAQRLPNNKISIHAPRAGSDGCPV